MNTDPALEIRSLASGIRAVALVFVLILSYFNARLAFQINHFRSIFNDMLGGQAFPVMTDIVIRNNTVFVILSLLLPLAAIAIVMVIRNHRTALYALSALMIIAFIQMHLVWTALFSPLVSIIDKMQAQ